MKPDYDVLIIGSGASGGMAAYTLTQKGVRCLMLDAGPLVDFNRVRTNKAPYELPYRGFGPRRKPRRSRGTTFNSSAPPPPEPGPEASARRRRRRQQVRP